MLWDLFEKPAVGGQKPLENMPSPGHSVLQKCLLDDQLCVLKGTEADLCDAAALQQLLLASPRPRPSAHPLVPETMAIPRAIWLNDEYVWELQDFYSGRA